jgi:hypothetical protein
VWRPAALAAAGLVLLTPRPALASGYWRAFGKYWSEFVGDVDGVVLVAIVVGLISLFIITRGKWVK